MEDALLPSPVLRDAAGRAVTYLRVSVTERCNLHCAYCRPTARTGEDPIGRGGGGTPLTFPEIARVAALAARHGVSKIRLTGGEPLLRPGLDRLCARLAALPGVRTLALTTNGTLLAPRLPALRAAGVTRLNISLDTLDRAVFARLTGADRLPDVLRGIAGAAAAGWREVRLNCVLQRQVNGECLEDLVEFALARGLTLRFIEAMPLGRGAFDRDAFLPAAAALARLRRRYPLVPRLPGAWRAEPDRGPAREYEVAGTGSLLGFIPAHVGGFCPRCNRLRLLADGRVKPCLYAAPTVPLKPLLRAGAPDAEVRAAIDRALAAKAGDGRRPSQGTSACWRTGESPAAGDCIAAVGG